MSLDLQALESDMVFLSENAKRTDIKMLADKWLKNIWEANDEIKRLKDIIEHREHDISCLDSELRQANDLIADLKDKLRK